MVEKWGGCHALCDLRHWGLRPFGGVYVGWVVIGWVQGQAVDKIKRTHEVARAVPH